VQIRLRPGLSSAGRASYPGGRVVSRATVDIHPGIERGWPVPAGRAVVTGVVVHELAHVLGLNHENRRCATMNSVLWARCTTPPEQWRYRCRGLERDDVRGLIRLYGGRLRGVGPELCAAEPAPSAPVGLTAATIDAARGVVRVTWNTGTAPVARAQVLRKAGTCPTGPDDRQADLVASIETAPGRVQTVDDFGFSPGVHCYLVVMSGRLGRPGPAGTAAFTFLGQPPTARFGYAQYGADVSFLDNSYDPEGRLVAWSWSFGDGSGATGPEPVHAYAAPGTYQVTLTVTDDSGQVSTITEPVEVS
jgi:chitodextrinase